MIKILFVCLGNICRSPLAEGHFLKLIMDNNFQEIIECNSAGTAGYHIGQLADPRTRSNALSHGIHLTHKGRQLIENDFNDFDYILVMDDSNLSNVSNMQKTLENPRAKVFKMRHFDYDHKDSDVPDPYYDSEKEFEEVYQILKHSTYNFMNFLKNEHNL